MEKLLKTNKVKAIGVSNYSVKFLEELLPKAEIVPAVNQIENHPLLPQQDIADYCKSKGIIIEAYSPLGSTGSPLFADEGVKEVAKKHSVGEGTVLISYQGMSASASPSPSSSSRWPPGGPTIIRPRQSCIARRASFPVHADFFC